MLIFKYVPVPVIGLSNQLCGVRKLILGNIWVGFGSVSNWHKGFLGGSVVKSSPDRTGGAGSIPALRWSLWVRDPTATQMATHSNTLTWKMLWTEEPGRRQSMGPQRAGHDWAPEHTLVIDTSKCELKRVSLVWQEYIPFSLFHMSLVYLSDNLSLKIDGWCKLEEK